MPLDHDQVVTRLRRLAAEGVDDDVFASLRRTVTACADLFGVTGAGIMLVDEAEALHYVAASDGPGRILEIVESETGEGPCVQAFVLDRVVEASDLATDGRWPRAVPQVLAVGVRSILAVPIRVGPHAVGSLDVYRDHPHDWDSSETRAIVRFAETIESIVTAELTAHSSSELAGQLQYALDHRVLVERAIGYLMATRDVDSLIAFQQLRGTARSTRRKIGDVADELLRTRTLPDAGAAEAGGAGEPSMA